jgi:predicted nuclease of predicted toxin-antitoxin system
VKILLDESVPADLAEWLSPHEVTTVQFHGWSSLQNGALIAMAERRFDVLITADRNFRYQQNLASRSISIVVLPSNRLRSVKAMLPSIVTTLENLVGHPAYVEIPWQSSWR